MVTYFDFSLVKICRTMIRKRIPVLCLVCCPWWQCSYLISTLNLLFFGFVLLFFLKLATGLVDFRYSKAYNAGLQSQTISYFTKCKYQYKKVNGLISVLMDLLVQTPNHHSYEPHCGAVFIFICLLYSHQLLSFAPFKWSVKFQKLVEKNVQNQIS